MSKWDLHIRWNIKMHYYKENHKNTKSTFFVWQEDGEVFADFQIFTFHCGSQNPHKKGAMIVHTNLISRQ